MQIPREAVPRGKRHTARKSRASRRALLDVLRREIIR
jgi:hypothetical protein